MNRNLVTNMKGVAETRYSYDVTDSLLITVNLFGKKGSPVEATSGYHEVRYRYDQLGNRVIAVPLRQRK